MRKGEGIMADGGGDRGYMYIMYKEESGEPAEWRGAVRLGCKVVARACVYVSRFKDYGVCGTEDAGACYLGHAGPV